MHIISGQLLGILFPIFSYSHSIVAGGLDVMS